MNPAHGGFRMELRSGCDVEVGVAGGVPGLSHATLCLVWPCREDDWIRVRPFQTFAEDACPQASSAKPAPDDAIRRHRPR